MKIICDCGEEMEDSDRVVYIENEAIDKTFKFQIWGCQNCGKQFLLREVTEGYYEL